MKKLFGFLTLGVSLVLFLFFIWDNRAPQVKIQVKPTPFQKAVPTVAISDSVLFVPYWTLGTFSQWKTYQELVYFGITPNENGINAQEDGYKNMKQFIQMVPSNTKKQLVLRMTEQAINEKVLEDKNLREKIIKQTVAVAKANDFDGVVLDFEYNALSFPDVIAEINQFSADFANTSHQSKLSFYQTLFGDSFFRARPYNVAAIAKNADGIFVMSYDFHKANGTPGPNFPLTVRVDADYTFVDMVHDFSKDVPKEKLIIVFGMFGYDWTVDDKGRPSGQAKSLSDNDIQSAFLSTCTVKDCTISRDVQSKEPSVTYKDTALQQHVVWWEDIQSVESKKTILRQNGVSQIGFWANGYF